jgi:hypothetical protein
MTAKSVEKNPTAEAELRSWIDRLDPKIQKLFKSVRIAVRKRFPTANELAYDYKSFVVISYSPTEQGIDGIVAIAGRPDGVRLYFTNGPKLPDPKKLLQGSATLTRFVQVESVGQVSHPDIEAFTTGAIELSRVPLPANGTGALILRSSAKKKPPRKKAKKK